MISLLIGFSMTNAIVFQRVSHWLRTMVTGLDDSTFKMRVQNDCLCGFRQEALGRLFRCHTCMGFWIGIGLSFVIDYPIDSNFAGIQWLEHIAAGFLQSVFNTILWVILLKVDVEKL